MIRALAVVYAIGVLLAAPVTLHAADESAVKIETVPQAAPEPAPAQIQPAQDPASEPEPEPETKAAEPKPKPIAVKAAPGSVQMLDFSFSPATITVNVGESVTWVNAGQEPHNAVGDNFSTALLQAGKSGSKSFSSAGTFSYICTVHPQMKGTVKVVGAAAQTESQDPGTEDDSAASADTAEPTGPQLANSGLDAWLLGLAGVALLAAGLSIRRRVA